MAIMMMGRAGSGKSTVGKIVASRLGWRYVSTGEIARARLEGEELLFLQMGGFAPDQIIYDEVSALIREHNGQIVIDGMPRKVMQIGFLQQHLHQRLYVHLDIHEVEAMERLLKRGREDDTNNSILKRLFQYRRMIAKIMPELENRGEEICTISALREPEEIADIVINRLGE